MRRVLITGGAGFLGRALLEAAPAGVPVEVTLRRAKPALAFPCHVLDLAEERDVARVWERVRPDLVIHTAYSVAVPDRDIWAATRNVARASLAAGADLLYMSTDMVLDGERAPYAEEATPNPVLEYGRWKAKAEDYVRSRHPSAAVVRTSLLTSFHPLDPRSEAVARGLRGEVRPTLFADEIRCPISVHDLATQLWEIAALDAATRAGVWHLAGPEALSRYAIGLLIAAFLDLAPDRIIPAESRSGTGTRPRDLRLLTSRADALLRSRARAISLVAVEEKAARAASPPKR